MKNIYKNGYYTGERALYDTHDALIEDSTFNDGESPLKECSNLVVNHCVFKWKYPLWYSKHVEVYNTQFDETARSGIWYTKDLVMHDCHFDSPKMFRHAETVTLNRCDLPNAEETFWNCKNITLNHVTAKGNYFGLNVKGAIIRDFKLEGDYAFDGGSDIEIHNAVMDSKDSFWNCQNVVVYDSTIVGEYLGWNSQNVIFINCTIESHQGMCYMKNITMVNCKLINTDLCFEYCENVDADIVSDIDSVKNPISGRIKAKSIKQLIMDPKYIDPKRTTIEVEENSDEI